MQKETSTPIGRVNMNRGKATVVKDYIAREDEELTVIKGDVVTVKDSRKKIIRDGSGEWLEGVLEDGTTGIFPLSHVHMEALDLETSVDDEMARVEAALKKANLEREEALAASNLLKSHLNSVDEDVPAAPTPRDTAPVEAAPETNSPMTPTSRKKPPEIITAGSPSNAARALRKQKGGADSTEQPGSPATVSVSTGKAPQLVVNIVTGHVPVKWDWTTGDEENPPPKQHGCYPRLCFVHIFEDDESDGDSGASDNEQAEEEKKRKRMAELKRARAVSGHAAGENQHDLQAGTVNIGLHIKVGDLERLIRRKQGKMAVIDEKGRPLRLDEPYEFFSSAHFNGRLAMDETLQDQGILKPLRVRMDEQLLKIMEEGKEKRRLAANESNATVSEGEDTPAGIRVLHHCSVYQEIEDGTCFGKQGHVDLACRELDKVPQMLFEPIDRCNGLSLLMLNENNLKFVPPEIGQLRNLRTLMLGGNDLDVVPKGIEKLVLLQNLQLSNNLIKEVTWELARLANLRNLFLDGNKITTLPYEMRVLTKLEELQIGDNRFKEIPPQCFGMTSLTDLWCQGNKISIVPNTIQKLKKLKRLELSGNEIATLPPEFGNLSNLESLFMSANRLHNTSFPNDMLRLTALKTLYMQGNYITRRPAVLKEMQLNGNLEVCQLGVGSVVKGTLLRVFTQAAKSGDADIDAIALKAFSKYDESGDGAIDGEEFGMLVKDMGVHLTDEELAGALDYIDEDESGEIDTEEFLAWLKED